MSSLASTTSDARLRYLPVADIEPNPFQPRQIFDEEEMARLVASLRNHGVLQTVLVRSLDAGFQIIAGERRWRAAKEAGFKSVPCMVREADDATMILLADEENENRVMITDMDRALRIKRLWEAWESEGKKPSLRTIAAHLKKDKGWVSERLKLLDFHDDVIGMLERNENVLTVSKEINAEPRRERRAHYIAVIDAGGSRGDVLKVMGQDAEQDAEHAMRAQEHEQKLVDIKEAQTPPDRVSQLTQKFFEENGVGMTFGRSNAPVLSSNRDTAKQEIPAYIERIQTWAPHLSREDRQKFLDQLTRILGG